MAHSVQTSATDLMWSPIKTRYLRWRHDSPNLWTVPSGGTAASSRPNYRLTINHQKITILETITRIRPIREVTACRRHLIIGIARPSRSACSGASTKNAPSAATDSASTRMPMFCMDGSTHQSHTLHLTVAGWSRRDPKLDACASAPCQALRPGHVSFTDPPEPACPASPRYTRPPRTPAYPRRTSLRSHPPAARVAGRRRAGHNGPPGGAAASPRSRSH